MIVRYGQFSHFKARDGTNYTREGTNYAQFSILETVKIGFYHNFINMLWQNYTFDSSEFFVVLDIRLVISNIFLFY